MESMGFNTNARPISKSQPQLNKVRQFDGTMAMSSAHGLGQFIDDTWLEMLRKHGSKYGIANAGKLTATDAAYYRKDVHLQAAMLAEFTKSNIEQGRKLGGQDDNANTYALHNLGSGDGPKFLAALKQNPNAPVRSVLSKTVIARNSSLYGDGTISMEQAYRNMGKLMSAGDRYAKDASQQPTSAPTTATSHLPVASGDAAAPAAKHAARQIAEHPTQTAPTSAAASHSSQQAILDQRSHFNGYKYLYGGNGQKDAKGVNRIDCSHLVNQALTGAGYAIPYQTTAGMANSKYYEEVDAKDVKPGDIALWQGNKNHTGIVEAYDAKTGKGSFFGAQSKKGASSAQMGKGAWWGQPQKFLRPKAEYQQSPAAAAAKPVQAKPAESKPTAAKPVAQPSATPHAAQAAPASQSAAANSVQKLLKTEGTTRVYQMADGTVQTRTGGTVAWRNNNPGNLKFGYAGSHDKTDHSKRSKTRALSDAQKRYQGVVDLDQWGNAVFADEASGRAAKAQLLTKQHGDKTIEQMLPKYAVSDYSGKANHAKYAEGIYQFAASRGLDLHGKKIKDLSHPEFEALMDGMKKVEGFKAGKVAVSGTASNKPAAPIAPSAAPAAKAPTPTPAAAKPLPKPAASANQPKAQPKPAAPPKKPAAASQAPAAAGDAAEAQLSALIAQLSAALAQLTQPLRVVVDVQNGNIVAAVNAANSQQQRRS